MDIHTKVKNLGEPTRLPPDTQTAAQWQNQNRDWWENNPMRYDWKDKIDFPVGSREYFQEIDKRFFSNANEYMPWSAHPFEEILNFKDLRDKDVLEIGVGHGSHAALIAPFCKSYTGIDLTQRASEMTRKRFELFGLKGTIRQMDAEKMEFRDGSFDLIWSWGVIHHSSNTQSILKEMRRVLKENGEAIVMIYHRSFWKFHVEGLVRGIFQGLFFQGKGFNDILQIGTDGAIARHYTKKEWKTLCNDMFEITDVRIYGLKSEICLIPGSAFKNKLMKLIPNGVNRFFLNYLGWGSFLVARMKKK